MIPEFLKGQRDSVILQHNDFLYKKHSVKGGVTRWRCQIRSCTGHLLLGITDEIIQQAEHNPCGDALKEEKLWVLNALNARTLQTAEISSAIVSHAVSTITDRELKTKMPALRTMMDGVKRLRNKKNPHVSHEAEEFPDSVVPNKIPCRIKFHN